VTLSDWSTIKRQLGFTPYLPASLPKGTCLALAGGSVHDPIFGGRFLITYYLPATGPLSFSEAPKTANAPSHLSGNVQCSQAGADATPTATPPTTPATGTPVPTATAAPPLTICLGTIANTNLSMAASMSASDLQQLYNSLQPNVEWVPQLTKPTPTNTASI
jgi:hypothetical protein